jgi:hypothetical protein
VHGNRQHRRTGLEREPADAPARPAERARAHPRALGEDDHGAAALDDQRRGLHRRLVGLTAADRESAQARKQEALPALLEQLDLGYELHPAPPGHQDPDHERVEEAAVVGRDDHSSAHPRVLAARALDPQPDQESRREQQPREVIEKAAGAALTRVAVEAVEALLADHVVAARRRGAPGALIHACAYTPTADALLRGRYQALSIIPRISAASGESGT